MGEVAAVGEIEAQDAVAGREERHVGGGVGLRAGVRLDVDVFGAEELFGAVAGQVFDDVGVLAAAVVALSGVALCVFVGENGACGFEDRAADEVFGCDHLEAFVLALYFVFNLLGDLGVGRGQRSIQIDGHSAILCHVFAGFFLGGI